MPTTSVAQAAILGEMSQEAMSRPRLAVDKKLRRRLSKIFQRLKRESGFGPRPPAGNGTRGRLHPAICQSPRIQRWARPA